MTVVCTAKKERKPTVKFLTPASCGRNWDGESWLVEWSDGKTEQIRGGSASKRFDGLRYCRMEARRIALRQRYGRTK